MKYAFLLLLFAAFLVRAAQPTAEPVIEGRPLNAWTALLRSPDIHTRDHALRTFQQLGEEAAPALPALVKLLKDDSSITRQTVLQALGFLGPMAKEAIPQLIELFRDRDPLLSRVGPILAGLGTDAQTALVQALEHREVAIRRGAASCLRYCKPFERDSLTALRETLTKDREPSVREQVIYTLAQIKPDFPEVMGWILATLKDRDPIVKLAAVSALANLGPDALGILTEAVSDPKNPDRAAATLALARLGSDARPSLDVLIRALEDPLPEVRRHAALGMTNLWAYAKPALPVLTRLLQDKDVPVKMQALIAVYRIDYQLDGAAAIVKEALKTDDLETRRSAVLFLQATFGRIKNADNLLVDVLKDTEPLLRQIAAQALGYYRPASERTVAALTELLSDREAKVHLAALVTLGQLRASSRPILEKVAKDATEEDSALRSAALKFLANQRKESAPLLIARLRDKETAVRQRAVVALGDFEEEAPTVVPALLKALEDESPLVRVSAVGALARIGERKPSLTPLQTAFKGNYLEARRLAVATLANLSREPDAVAMLKEALRDNDPTIRREAARTAGQFGSAVKPILQNLADLLLDKDEAVSYEAAEALRVLGKEAETVLPALLKALGRADTTSAKVFTASLRGVGKDIEHLFLESLDAEDASLRAGAALALLANSQPRSPVSAKIAAGVEKQLKDKDALVRRAACAVVRSWGATRQDFSPLLLGVMDDTDARVREEASLGLAEQNRATEKCLPDLVNVLKKGPPLLSPGVLFLVAPDYHRALWTLQWFGPRAKGVLPQLMALLDDPRGAIRADAVSILTTIGPEARSAVPTLTKRLLDPATVVRDEAISALGAIGTDAASAVPTLTGLLKVREPSFRRRVLQTLAKIGPAAREAAAAVADQLDSGNSELRREAMLTLALLGEGVDALSKALASGPLPERRLAATLLAEFGTKATPALESLRKALKDPDMELRLQSALAISRAGGELGDDFAVLDEGMNHDDPLIRQLAASVAGRLGQEARRAIPGLNVCVRDSQPPVRRAALVSLEQIGPPAIPALIEMLEYRRIDVRRGAAVALGKMRAGEAVTALTEHLVKDESESMARVCVEALGYMGERGLAGLLKGLKHESPLIREAVVRTIGESKDPGRAAREAIRALSKNDEDDDVKNAAQDVLNKLDGKENK